MSPGKASGNTSPSFGQESEENEEKVSKHYDTDINLDLVMGDDVLRDFLFDLTQGKGPKCEKAKEYIREKKLLSIFQRLLSGLLIYRPEHPIKFLAQLLNELEEFNPEEFHLLKVDGFEWAAWEKKNCSVPFTIRDEQDSNGKIGSVVIPPCEDNFRPQAPVLNDANLDTLVRILDPGKTGHITLPRLVNTLKVFNIIKYADIHDNMDTCTYEGFKEIMRCAVVNQVKYFQELQATDDDDDIQVQQIDSD